jgi:dual-specificity kinase
VPHFTFVKGEVFNKVYTAEAFLADGTFGRVLRVRKANDKRSYAMKIIKADKRHIDNAKIEVEILETVHTYAHSGRKRIVNMVDSFPHGDNFCIVFEELGKSLYDTLLCNDFVGFPVDGIKRMLKDVLKGLAFMHEIGLTHTDLKPENILFVT